MNLPLIVTLLHIIAVLVFIGASTGNIAMATYARNSADIEIRRSALRMSGWFQTR